MGTEPETAALSMNCQVKATCTHLASYVLSGSVSGVMLYTCALHLAVAIDDALGKPVLTPGRQPERTVRRA